MLSSRWLNWTCCRDGVLDAQEFARAFTKGLLSIEDEGYQEWLRISRKRPFTILKTG